MTLYLLAHVVRGEPAFDIGEQMRCPMCALDEQGAECVECDSTGYWWIIPTSGHRAYPYWNINLDSLMHDTSGSISEIDPIRTLGEVPPMPPSWPDHYQHRAAPASAPRPSLTSLLNLTRPSLPPITRRKL